MATQGTVDTETGISRERPSVTGATASVAVQGILRGSSSSGYPPLYCPSCRREVPSGGWVDGAGGVVGGEGERGGAAPATSSAGAGAAGAGVGGGARGIKRRRLDLSYLRTLLEANAAAGALTSRAAGAALSPDAPDPVVLIVPREDASAARNICARPVPIPLSEVSGTVPAASSASAAGTDAGSIPAPNWTGDCEGVWVPQDGCYYVPLRCGDRWIGARVEATDHARRQMAGCTLLLRDALTRGAGGGGGGGGWEDYSVGVKRNRAAALVEAAAARKRGGGGGGGRGGAGEGGCVAPPPGSTRVEQPAAAAKYEYLSSKPRKRRLRTRGSLEAAKELKARKAAAAAAAAAL